jgi:hypothetical protein
VNGLRPLIVISAALLVGAWVTVDLLVHGPSSLILRTVRRWLDARYARKWGLPSNAFDPAMQGQAAAKLRADAVRAFGMTETQWLDFTAAHETSAGGAS